MGSVASDDVAGGDEKPQRSVYLDAFRIDRTEVTNGMYARCVAAGACEPPVVNYSRTLENYYGDPQYSNYPVVSVWQRQAQTYCEWAGMRLPTEAEWEKAARGTDARKYPWGNEAPDRQRANVLGLFEGNPVPVGSFPAGASPYGALDMTGNVWEWTANYYCPEYYTKAPQRNPPGPDWAWCGQVWVVRGGASGEDELDARVANRWGWSNWEEWIGFRCACSD